MDYQKRKQELINEFNSNQQTLNQLQQRQLQIIGQLNLIEELEKEEKEKVEKKK